MLFSAGPFKQRDTCNVMVDHFQSHVTPWHQYTSHVKVHGTLSKMDVWLFQERSLFTRMPAKAVTEPTKMLGCQRGHTSIPPEVATGFPEDSLSGGPLARPTREKPLSTHMAASESTRPQPP